MTLILEALPLRNSRVRVAMGALLFIVCASKAWDSAFIKSMRRLRDMLEASGGRGSRVTLMGVVCLAAARYVLELVALLTIASLVAALLMYSATYTGDVLLWRWWRSLGLAGPSVWFHMLHPHHLRVHAAVFGGALLLGLLQVVLYVSDADLKDGPSVRSKAARIVMGIAALTLVGYIIYAVTLLAFVGRDAD